MNRAILTLNVFIRAFFMSSPSGFNRILPVFGWATDSNEVDLDGALRLNVRPACLCSSSSKSFVDDGILGWGSLAFGSALNEVFKKGFSS